MQQRGSRPDQTFITLWNDSLTPNEAVQKLRHQRMASNPFLHDVAHIVSNEQLKDFGLAGS
ncbi:hypothetical protein DPMN_015231 [Dreissena polymorpha]|uniref:Uncharacterized protein n=1 Tax=Dreissena polymorpha TaxID=45954 RepID=A0A9D4N7D9_DREPO|nr:hypothetical protein DPMN_015231 [Dreissena polymorpha]